MERASLKVMFKKTKRFILPLAPWARVPFIHENKHLANLTGVSVELKAPDAIKLEYPSPC